MAGSVFKKKPKSTIPDADEDNPSYTAELWDVHRPNKPIVLAEVQNKEAASTHVSPNNDNREPKNDIVVKAISYTVDFCWHEDLDKTVRNIIAMCRYIQDNGVPLTVDFQDGFSETFSAVRGRDAVTRLLSGSTIGTTIQDSRNDMDPFDGWSYMRPVGEVTNKINGFLVGTSGVYSSMFIINARTDIMMLDGVPGINRTREQLLKEAIARGKAYLAAGASSVFVSVAVPGSLTREEIDRLVRGLDRRTLAVQLAPEKGDLSYTDLTTLEVVRVNDHGASLTQELMRNKEVSVVMVKEIIAEGESLATLEEVAVPKASKRLKLKNSLQKLIGLLGRKT